MVAIVKLNHMVAIVKVNCGCYSEGESWLL